MPTNQHCSSYNQIVYLKRLLCNKRTVNTVTIFKLGILIPRGK